MTVTKLTPFYHSPKQVARNCVRGSCGDGTYVVLGQARVCVATTFARLSPKELTFWSLHGRH